MSAGASLGPVIFAYDGSELAKLAIDEAARQLETGRDALVLTVWQQFEVGFEPSDGVQLDAGKTAEVRKAAERTAADGAAIAERAGFRARERGDRRGAGLEADRRGRPRGKAAA